MQTYSLPPLRGVNWEEVIIRDICTAFCENKAYYIIGALYIHMVFNHTTSTSDGSICACSGCVVFPAVFFRSTSIKCGSSDHRVPIVLVTTVLQTQKF